jgi:hypothetical protein
MDTKEIRRSLRKLAIPNITMYLVMGQTLFFVFALANPKFFAQTALMPRLVLEGEWWRIFSFIFVPPSMNPLWLFLALYFFLFIGNTLENQWGTPAYNLYLLIGYVATVAASFIFPDQVATNLFIQGSIFYAFAFLFPEFVIYLFFILPVKIKWIALISATMTGLAFMFGAWGTKVLILASVLNFLLFFRKDIVQHARTSRRQMKQKAEKLTVVDQPFHVCAVCGITDKTHRNMDFRYCPGCGGRLAYCTEHLNNHVHRPAG